MVCYSSGCESINSKAVYEKFLEFADGNLKVCKTGCLGLCGMGPNVLVYPGEIFYNRVKSEDVEEIVKKTRAGEVVTRLLYKDKDGVEYKSLKDIPFFKTQTFIARANIGEIDPEDINDYIAVDGYSGLLAALNKTQDEVIDIVSKSGIRGRGGAGFPTGKKWAFAKASVSEEKYVVCNADEGDPGAFMDRSIMESNPHAIIEALEIAGYAIGARHGIVYVRAEYPLAGERLEKAICDAKNLGFWVTIFLKLIFVLILKSNMARVRLFAEKKQRFFAVARESVVSQQKTAISSGAWLFGKANSYQ